MKRAIFALVAFGLFSEVVWSAGQAFDFRCYTEILSTSTEVSSDGETAKIRIFQHNGNKFMPIHDGLVVYHDVEYIKDKAEVLYQLPSDFTLEGKAENCTIRSNRILSCFSKDEVKVGKFVSKGFYFYSHRKSVDTGHGVFASTVTALNLRLDGKSYWIPMEYPDPSCRM